MRKLTLIAFLHLALIVTTNAQKSIYNKPYEQWTLNEVGRMLTNSPWAQIDSDVGRGPGGTSYLLAVRLYSALEVGKLVQSGQVIF